MATLHSFLEVCSNLQWVARAWSSYRLAASWTTRGSSTGGGGIYAPILAGSGAHPASCTMGAGTFLGVKRPGLGVYYPPQSSAEVKETAALYLCSPTVSPCHVIGRILLFPLVIKNRRYHYEAVETYRCFHLFWSLYLDQ